MKDKGFSEDKKQGGNLNGKAYFSSGEKRTDFRKSDQDKRTVLIEEEDDRKPNVMGYTAIIFFVLGFNSDSILLKIILFGAALILGIIGMASRVRQKAISLMVIILSVVFLAGPVGSLPDVIDSLHDGGDVSAVKELLLFNDEEASVEEDISADDADRLHDKDEGEPRDDAIFETEGKTEPETEPETEPQIPIEDLISIESYKTPRDLVTIITNNSDSYVYIMLDVIFYDAEGNMLSMQEDSVGECAPGQRVAGYVLSPRTNEGVLIDYETYEIRPDIDERELRPGHEYYGDQFIIESNIAVDGSVLADISNPTGLYFDSLTLCCIFYSGEEVVGISIDSSSGFGEEDVFKFYPPYDADFQQLSFDRYEIIINSTLRYQ